MSMDRTVVGDRDVVLRPPTHKIRIRLLYTGERRERGTLASDSVHYRGVDSHRAVPHDANMDGLFVRQARDRVVSRAAAGVEPRLSLVRPYAHYPLARPPAFPGTPPAP